MYFPAFMLLKLLGLVALAGIVSFWYTWKTGKSLIAGQTQATRQAPPAKATLPHRD